MISFNHFLDRPEFKRWQTHFADAIALRNNPQRHGDLPKWLKTLDQLPNIKPSVINLNSNAITLGDENDITSQQLDTLRSTLMDLAPWRKGPYHLFGVDIDTEWRSDWKWDRVQPHLSDLTGRKILDVGCGTGYHCWRMLGDGADYVMGIDPSMRFIVQNEAIQKYAQDRRFDFLPLGIEDMPTDLPYFDSVFSMGVLYHRRNPINHLFELKQLLKDNGELVLETLIIDEVDDGILTPEARYAQMRNVWSIMTVEKILTLLNEAGFKESRCVDQNVTSLDEQRQTDWMQFHSLKQFLDPNDISKTVEGYPAPKRGLFIAKK